MNNSSKAFRKKFNKHYSTNEQLVYGVNLLCDELKSRCFTNGSDDEVVVIEPFAGDCDLLMLLKDQLNMLRKPITLYDITNINISSISDVSGNSNISCHEHHDSLLNSVFDNNSNNKSNGTINRRTTYFVITNPPYTAKNKLSAEMKLKYANLLTTNVQDLYQIFIQQLISSVSAQSNINGGFIIVPSNFMFGKQSKQLRDEFLRCYDVLVLNVFEKVVFEHTTQSVVSILFVSKQQQQQQPNIKHQHQANNQQLNQQLNQQQPDNQQHQQQQPNIKQQHQQQQPNNQQHQQQQQPNIKQQHQQQQQPNINQVYLHLPNNTIESINNILEIINFDFESEFNVSDAANIHICRNYNINHNVFTPTTIKISLLDPHIYAFTITASDNKPDKPTDRAFMCLCLDHNTYRTLHQLRPHNNTRNTNIENVLCSMFNEQLARVRHRTHSLIFTSYRECSRKRLTFNEAFILMKYVIHQSINPSA